MMGGVKTFVVRLFVPAENGNDPASDALHGIVEDVANGSSVRFASGRELLAFLAAESERPARPAERAAR